MRVSLGVIRRYNYPPHLQGTGRRDQGMRQNDATPPCFKFSTLLSVVTKLTNLNHNSLHIFTRLSRITIASLLRVDNSTRLNPHRRIGSYIRDKFRKENLAAFLRSLQTDLQFCYPISSFGYEKHFYANFTFMQR